MWYVGAVLVVFCLYSTTFFSLTYYANSQGIPATAFTGSIDDPDTGEYLILGHTLLETGQFLNGDHLTPASFRTPGYPFLIAILVKIFESDIAIQFTQFLLVGISSVFIYLLGVRLWSKWVGFTAAALYVFDPLVLLYSFTTMAETLFNVIFFGATVLLTKESATKWHFLAGGLLMGAATLVRPMGLYLLPVFFLWIVLNNWKRWRVVAQQGIVLFLGVALLVVPWMSFNQVRSGHFTISSIGPYDMLMYNIPEFMYQWKGIPPNETRLKIYDELGLAQSKYNDSLLRSYSYMDAVGQLAIKYISDAPVRYGIYHIASTVGFFLGSDISATKSLLSNQGLFIATDASVNQSYLLFHGEWREFLRTMVAELPELVERMAWLMLLVASFAVAIYMLISRSPAASLALLYLFLILSVAVLIGPVSEPRFRLTVAPFIYILGFTGLYLAAAYLKNRLSALPKAGNSSTSLP